MGCAWFDWLLRGRMNKGDQPAGHITGSLRQRVYDVLERGSEHDILSLTVNRVISLFVVVNLLIMTLETVPSLHAQYGRLFFAFEMISLVVFTLEYAAIIWSAREHPLLQHLPSWRARLSLAMSPAGLVDLMAVLPFWLALVMDFDLRILLVLRVFRFLKLTRYSPAMRSLLDVLYAERRALFGCLVILLGLTLVAATIMHVVEGQIQPKQFGTIPDSMWWALVTLATVGYGDAVPITLAGKIVAAGTIISGLVMLALPVGIIATAFSEQVHRRDFVVTWSMVSRVPLFAGLEASSIADIMQLLRARTVEAGTVIARRGEPAHSMYFISKGGVDIDLPGQRIRMSAGHFFGEIAVIKRTQRSATVTALTRCDLLVLEAHDFHALLNRDPLIAERVNRIMETRLGMAASHMDGTPQGDIVREEMQEG